MRKKSLRIAQLVLPWMSLPPIGYGGTEKVVYNLSEGLVKKGHQVTVFSVGESKLRARVAYIFKKAFGLQANVMGKQKSSFYPWMHVAYCFERQAEFDIIHSHAQFLALPFAACSKTPSLHTFHRTFEFARPDEKDLVFRYSHLNFSSISNSQRVSGLHFVATVYNGIDTNQYSPVKKSKRNYLFWSGRLIKKKGPWEAIQIAKKLRMPLIMSGKITNHVYFIRHIQKHIDGKLIKFVGELNTEQMNKYFGNAILTLVPVTWNEPFGLVPVESMACGTPVVGYGSGGLKETVKHGVTGFLVSPRSGFSGLLKKTKEVLEMSNDNYVKVCQAARRHVERNFSVEKMVCGYEDAYYKILKHKV